MDLAEEIRILPCTTYALDVLEGKFPTSKYIQKICKRFLYEIDHQEELNYFFDCEMARNIVVMNFRDFFPESFMCFFSRFV